MLTFSNTLEIEEYGLNRISDDEQIRILGGMHGKPKYDDEKYIRRTTYTGRQVKQIISEMQLIESSIPMEWNEMQRAKFIYEVLGNNIGYNYNSEDYKTEQCSNLTVLLSRSGICAGYSLLFKEMMDRQGIECDYIRGLVPTRNGFEKHAWNVLTIKGEPFPVDLTFDSRVLRGGGTELENFGNDQEFESEHIADQDEVYYIFTFLTNETVRNINTTNNRYDHDLYVRKRLFLQVAMEETYKKFNKEQGKEAAIEQVEGAIKKYIYIRNPNYFTNNGNARQQLIQFIKPNEMIDVVVQAYLEQLPNIEDKQIVDSSTQATMDKHGIEFAREALKEYIMCGRCSAFTRDFNARDNIKKISREDAFKYVIDSVIQGIIRRLEATQVKQQGNINSDESKKYFSGQEFADVSLPSEKSNVIISKAASWIKERFNNKNKRKSNVEDLNKMETKDK